MQPSSFNKNYHFSPCIDTSTLGCFNEYLNSRDLLASKADVMFQEMRQKNEIHHGARRTEPSMDLKAMHLLDFSLHIDGPYQHRSKVFKVDKSE